MFDLKRLRLYLSEEHPLRNPFHIAVIGKSCLSGTYTLPIEYEGDEVVNSMYMVWQT